MNCPVCGNAVAEGAKFCNLCGEPLDGSAQQAGAGAADTQATTPGEDIAADAAYQPYTVGDGAAQAAQTSQQGYTVGGSTGWQQAAQPASPYQNQYQTQYPMAAETIYPMTESDTTLRLINFILCVISTVTCAALIVPLAWMIPMTVISWGIYKGKKRNTTAFGVCTLIFVNVIGGILLLCSHKDE